MRGERLGGMKNEEGMIWNGKPTSEKGDNYQRKFIKNIWVEYNEDE